MEPKLSRLAARAMNTEMFRSTYGELSERFRWRDEVVSKGNWNALDEITRGFIERCIASDLLQNGGR